MIHPLIKKTHLGLVTKGTVNQLLVLLSFEITFVLARIITHLQKNDILPNQEGDLHIHHLVPGIILLLIAGYIAVIAPNWKKFGIVTILFGIGAALTIDEFALWLNLQDLYWEKEGRQSIDAIIIISVLLSISLLISEAHDHKWLKWNRQ